MYTQCPECLSVFSLDARTLAQAHGHVVCGHCRAAFDSLVTLAKTLPPEPFRELPLNIQGSEPPRIELVIYRPRPDEPAIAARPAATENFSQLVFAPRFVREKIITESRRPKERTTTRHRRETRDRRWPWVVVGLLLIIVLGGQLGWANRDMLIRDPLVGGWLRTACDTAGCELPLVAAPKQLRLLASNVQAHPSVSGALMISASVRNDAIFSQPFPFSIR